MALSNTVESLIMYNFMLLPNTVKDFGVKFHNII